MTQPTAPTFDIADAELPAITRGSDTAGPNPFADVLKASHDTRTGKAVTVPADQVPTVIRYIRRAANDLNIGSRIVLVAAKSGESLSTETVGGTKGDKGRTRGGKTVVIKADGTRFQGNVKVLFQGQKRKARKADTAPAAAPAETTPSA